MLKKIFEFSKQFLFVASAGAAEVANIVGDRAARTSEAEAFELKRAFHGEQAVCENSGGSVSNHVVKNGEIVGERKNYFLIVEIFCDHSGNWREFFVKAAGKVTFVAVAVPASESELAPVVTQHFSAQFCNVVPAVWNFDHKKFARNVFAERVNNWDFVGSNGSFHVGRS